MGATSFSVGRGASTLQKVASVRMLHQLPSGQRSVSHPLTRKVDIFVYISYVSLQLLVYILFVGILTYVFLF